MINYVPSNETSENRSELDDKSEYLSQSNRADVPSPNEQISPERKKADVDEGDQNMSFNYSEQVVEGEQMKTDIIDPSPNNMQNNTYQKQIQTIPYNFPNLITSNDPKSPVYTNELFNFVPPLSNDLLSNMQNGGSISNNYYRNSYQIQPTSNPYSGQVHNFFNNYLGANNSGVTGHQGAQGPDKYLFADESSNLDGNGEDSNKKI
jgi:hypothetical protein